MEFILRLEIDFGVSVGGIFKLFVQPDVLARFESWEFGRCWMGCILSLHRFRMDYFISQC